jgi:hypothetical protein
VSERPAAADATQDGVVLLHGISRTARSFRKMQAALERAGFVTFNLDYASRRKAPEALRRTFIPPSSALPIASTAPFISSAIPWAGCWPAYTLPGIGQNAWAAS